jgi:hypothetical protein
MRGLRKVTTGHLPKNCPAGHLKRTTVFPDLTNQRLAPGAWDSAACCREPGDGVAPGSTWPHREPGWNLDDLEDQPPVMN